MGRVFSFVALLAVLAVGAWYYMHQTQSTLFGGATSGGTANPTSTVDVIGIRSDLLAIAQAERAHIALKGSYASLEQLRADGDLTMTHNRRGPYIYSVDISSSSFRVIATYTGPDAPGVTKTYSIDETMHITQE